ncbi:MAG: hypothetical protein C0625_01945 [Arcobacter sp.]|nr:MAG: hypothetical protein C0625_01945 [Arcobacter sp.]
MIEQTHLLSDENGYKRFNHFEISDELENLLANDYFLYNTIEFNKQDLVNDLYKINFENKYNRETEKEIFNQYIDNDKFKEKAQFVYSIIDYEKYSQFVLNNPEITNANNLTIKYSILDSDGVKVQIYFISILDISFVF